MLICFSLTGQRLTTANHSVTIPHPLSLHVVLLLHHKATILAGSASPGLWEPLMAYPADLVMAQVPGGAKGHVHHLSQAIRQHLDSSSKRQVARRVGTKDLLLGTWKPLLIINI